MNSNSEKSIGTRERDDALLNFAVRRAQEAILNPDLPESNKDIALEKAISTIQKVAERKSAYHSKYGEGRRARKPRIIYEASRDAEKERENIPPVIVQLNEDILNTTPEGMNGFTVEGIAEKAGISKNVLYEWAKGDTEFSTALERLHETQKNDPLKKGTEEDTFVNSMTIALLLLETRERHYESRNL